MFVFIACGIWLIGLGLYFMLLRPPLLPEDLRYMGTSAGEIQSPMPGAGTLAAPGFHCDGWLHDGCGRADDLRDDDCISRAREVDLDRPRFGRAIHGRDDEPDELSAQLRFQMAAPDTVSTLGHRTGVPPPSLV